jgi:hypothetical protein
VKTTFKVLFLIAALTAVASISTARAACSDYVGVVAGDSFSFDIKYSAGTSSISGTMTMHVDNVTDHTTYCDVGVTLTVSGVTYGGLASESMTIPIPSTAPAASFGEYLINKNTSNKSISSTLSASGMTIAYSATWDANGVLSSMEMKETMASSTLLDVSITRSGAGSALPGFDSLIIAGIVALGVAMLAIKIKRKN